MSCILQSFGPEEPGNVHHSACRLATCQITKFFLCLKTMWDRMALVCSSTFHKGYFYTIRALSNSYRGTGDHRILQEDPFRARRARRPRPMGGQPEKHLLILAHLIWRESRKGSICGYLSGPAYPLRMSPELSLAGTPYRSPP